MRSVRVGRGVGSNFEVLEGLKPGEMSEKRQWRKTRCQGQVQIV